MKFIYFFLVLPFQGNSSKKFKLPFNTGNKACHKELTNVEPELFGDYRKHYKTGYCEPYMNHTDDSKEKMEKINLHFHRFFVLKQLESNISIYDKLNIVDHYDLNTKYNLNPNIFSGGLLEDWEFEL